MNYTFEFTFYILGFSLGYLYFFYKMFDNKKTNSNEKRLLEVEEEKDCDLDLYVNEDDYTNQELSEERTKNLKCNITLDIMRDPVIDKYGFSFEKKEIIDWIKKNKKCPMNRKELDLEDLRNNIAIKNAIKYEILRNKYKRLYNNV